MGGGMWQPSAAMAMVGAWPLSARDTPNEKVPMRGPRMENVGTPLVHSPSIASGSSNAAVVEGAAVAAAAAAALLNNPPLTTAITINKSCILQGLLATL